MQQIQPTVFVSHAIEDKDRFVSGFAQRLRHSGIDAWVDKWEMRSGDSFSGKVFEENLNEASAVIVILSHNSVSKPWIINEIDDHFIKTVNHASRILPITIDDCIIPDAFKPSTSIRIKNLTQYDQELRSITNEISGKIGTLTKSNALSNRTIAKNTPHFSRTLTERVFNHSCVQYIENQGIPVQAQDIFPLLDSMFPTQKQFDSSLLTLKKQLLIESAFFGTSVPSLFTITHTGLEQYLTRNLIGYEEIQSDTVTSIVLREALYNYQIADFIQQPIQIVNHILEKLHRKGLIKIRKIDNTKIEICSIASLLH